MTIPGFYDGVAELPKATKKQWQSLKFSDAKFLKEVGLKQPAGEKGKSVLEQIWARPTAEVNGIWGGYTGVGTKTVLPSQAHAKVTFRLVGKQDPDKVLKAFQGFVKELIPKDCKVEFSGRGGGSPATEIAGGQSLHRQVGQGAEGRVPARRGADGLWRIDPHLPLLQGHSRHGQRPRGLRPQRRCDPQPQREI